MTVWLHEQRSGIRPFGAPDRFSNFTPTRVTVETDAGEVLQERKGTSEDLHEPMRHGQWDALSRATFNGYAMWNYMTTPFFMLLPGMKVEEIEPRKERDEFWRVLQVTFPDNIMGHSPVQEYYFDKDFLFRRVDYTVDVAVKKENNFDTAHYVYDYREVNGIKFPTTRRAYKRDKEGRAMMDELMIWIDLSDLKLS